MKIKVSDERKGNVNYANTNILECVKFWNREGEDTYAKNRSGDLGTEETNEMALKMSYDDFVLDMLLIDCKTFSNTKDATCKDTKIEVGRTRSHVWVHENNERVLMIYVE